MYQELTEIIVRQISNRVKIYTCDKYRLIYFTSSILENHLKNPKENWQNTCHLSILLHTKEA